MTGRVGTPGRRRAAAVAAALLVPAAALALLVHAAWSPLLRLDDGVTASGHRAVLASAPLLAAARLLTHLGDPPLLWGATLLGAAALARRAPRAALLLLLSRVVAQLLSTGTKVLVGRPRPVVDEPVSSASGMSFPSGHALGAAAFWATLVVVLLPVVPEGRRRPLAGLALLVAVVVAATCVLLGVHFLSDVVAGLLLGLAVPVALARMVPGERRA